MAVRTISTVVAPAQSLALCTLDDVREELRLGPEAGQDAYLTKLIARCSAAIVQHCNAVTVPETRQDRFLSGPEAVPETAPETLAALQLSRSAVTAIVSVQEAGLPLNPETDFALDGAAGILYRLAPDGDLAAWSLPTIVVFQAGEAVPPDLADAAVRLVKARFYAQGRDPLLRSESIPGVREASWWVSASSEDGAFPPDVADLLDHYRTPVIA